MQSYYTGYDSAQNIIMVDIMERSYGIYYSGLASSIYKSRGHYNEGYLYHDSIIIESPAQSEHIISTSKQRL